MSFSSPASSQKCIPQLCEGVIAAENQLLDWSSQPAEDTAVIQKDVFGKAQWERDLKEAKLVHEAHTQQYVCENYDCHKDLSEFSNSATMHPGSQCESISALCDQELISFEDQIEQGNNITGEVALISFDEDEVEQHPQKINAHIAQHDNESEAKMQKETKLQKVESTSNSEQLMCDKCHEHHCICGTVRLFCAPVERNNGADVAEQHKGCLPSELGVAGSSAEVQDRQLDSSIWTAEQRESAAVLTVDAGRLCEPGMQSFEWDYEIGETPPVLDNDCDIPTVIVNRTRPKDQLYVYGLTVNIGDVKVLGILDSGAAITCLHTKFKDYVSPDVHGYIMISGLLKGLTVKAPIHQLDFSFMSLRFQMDVCLVDMADEMLLGVDFMTKYQVTPKMDEGTVVIDQKNFGMTPLLNHQAIMADGQPTVGDVVTSTARQTGRRVDSIQTEFNSFMEGILGKAHYLDNESDISRHLHEIEMFMASKMAIDHNEIYRISPDLTDFSDSSLATGSDDQLKAIGDSAMNSEDIVNSLDLSENSSTMGRALLASTPYPIEEPLLDQGTDVSRSDSKTGTRPTNKGLAITTSDNVMINDMNESIPLTVTDLPRDIPLEKTKETLSIQSNDLRQRRVHYEPERCVNIDVPIEGKETKGDEKLNKLFEIPDADPTLQHAFKMIELQQLLYRIASRNKTTIIHHNNLKRCKDRRPPRWARKMVRSLDNDSPLENTMTDYNLTTLFEHDGGNELPEDGVEEVEVQPGGQPSASEEKAEPVLEERKCTRSGREIKARRHDDFKYDF